MLVLIRDKQAENAKWHRLRIFVVVPFLIALHGARVSIRCK